MMTFNGVEMVKQTVEKKVEKIIFKDDRAKLICTDCECEWRDVDILAQVMICVVNGCYDEAAEWLAACEDHADENDVFDLLYTAVKAYAEAEEEA